MDLKLAERMAELKRQWDNAIEIFKEALGHNPNDKPSKMYIERANYLKENPPPADWTEGKPGGYQPSGDAKPVVNRFERAYSPSAGGSASPSSTPVTLPTAPPRTIGSKIPINRRHKRRR